MALRGGYHELRGQARGGHAPLALRWRQPEVGTITNIITITTLYYYYFYCYYYLYFYYYTITTTITIIPNQLGRVGSCQWGAAKAGT